MSHVFKRLPEWNPLSLLVHEVNDYVVTEKGCWINPGTVTPTRLHRKAMQAELGRKLTRWEFVCHSCDNQLCFNPSHLFLGSPRDNSQDSIKKGRFTLTKLNGETKAHKLTDFQVSEIKNLLLESRLSQTEIGRLYGVTQSHISRIKTSQVRNKPTMKYKTPIGYIPRKELF
jgi:hypothetical protein